VSAVYILASGGMIAVRLLWSTILYTPRTSFKESQGFQIWSSYVHRLHIFFCPDDFFAVKQPDASFCLAQMEG
jgi:hypothetical protein